MELDQVLSKSAIQRAAEAVVVVGLVECKVQLENNNEVNDKR